MEPPPAPAHSVRDRPLRLVDLGFGGQPILHLLPGHETLRFGKGFRLALGNRRTQAAEMVIEPGGAEGGPGNRHRGADQWLFVVDGTGQARIQGRIYPLRAGALVLIEHGDRHEIRNTGRVLLKTLNFYSPPAYRRNGDELPRAKPH